jgi:SnoaL-like domain
MTVPNAEEIRAFYDRYFRTWNEHDRDGFIENWKSFVTDVTAEDPVGTPLKRGFDEIVIGAWDLMNTSVSMHLEELIVCGSEAAMVVRNEVTIGDEHVSARAIEIHRFADDGSVHLRNWWEAQGEMLEGYAAGTES